MDCERTRSLLRDRRLGALEEDDRSAVEAHLASCPECTQEAAVDEELSRLLEERRRRVTAPEALRASIEQRLSPALPPRRPRDRFFVPALAFAAGVALAITGMLGWRARSEQAAMVTEAVNDHLRFLYSDHALGVDSSEHHVVKPWFEGRLDFAPRVFDGDADFVLQGGAVGYFVDRRAATLVYRRHLHWVTLFETRADGLSWPTIGAQAVGASRGVLHSSRGFHVLLWRDGEIGYALVSDVDERELTALGERIAGR